MLPFAALSWGTVLSMGLQGRTRSRERKGRRVCTGGLRSKHTRTALQGAEPNTQEGKRQSLVILEGFTSVQN